MLYVELEKKIVIFSGALDSEHFQNEPTQCQELKESFPDLLSLTGILVNV